VKYGESTFDILYLLFAIISGTVILIKAKDRAGRLMGFATLFLGFGDAFHLVPRVLNYFVNADFTAALGLGKLVTSVTMTLFYVLIYHVWLEYFRMPEKKSVTAAVWLLAAIRVALCAFPQNGWVDNGSDTAWAIIRNVPFVMLGALISFLYFGKRNDDRIFKPVWLYILLSFAFYIPVAVGAGFVPILGMLMLPKTVCYILLIIVFLSAVYKKRRRPA
jgi:hypothetical protein